ncbi:hypothetical protein F511_35758 [Dorcoceras hygrometricum]|uniref:Uncharacterized protein n=1 Tax=Dorcoceras hygrometricum TaxID=472368 RepID=A0A2Z7BY97_9LAMI|nr:hypothetical protein F511_35758 [Dorcoceras hygrometricum]
MSSSLQDRPFHIIFGAFGRLEECARHSRGILNFLDFRPVGSSVPLEPSGSSWAELVALSSVSVVACPRADVVWLSSCSFVVVRASLSSFSTRAGGSVDV